MQVDQSLIWLSAATMGATHLALVFLGLLMDLPSVAVLNGGFSVVCLAFAAIAKRVGISPTLLIASITLVLAEVYFLLVVFPGPIVVFPFILLPIPALRVLGFRWGGGMTVGVMGLVAFSVFGANGSEVLSHTIAMNVLFSFGVACAFGVMLEVSRHRGEKKLESTLKDLHILSGFIPICSSCKSVPTEDNRWVQIEALLHREGQVEFSHGYCPDCLENTLLELSQS